MNTKLVEDIAAAVLYEGYLLYPYRASALKNRQRWNFGVLYPRGYAGIQSGSSDTWSMQLECLLRAAPDTTPSVRVRFLELIGAPEDDTCRRAIEREVVIGEHSLADLAAAPLRRGQVCAPEEGRETLQVVIEIEARQLSSSLFKLRATVMNASQFAGAAREDALMQSLVSTHAILSVDSGEFISLLDPPEELCEAASGCQNIGVWPVLVGEEGQRDAMLCSPIILYDYPQIAPESPGALFDGTEIDEILTLRILTMTDEEKQAMAATDERAREILQRTESMPPEQFLKMHGVLRGIRGTP
jgi:hypothetical protein